MTTKRSLASVSICNRLNERHDIHMNGNKTGHDVAQFQHLGINWTGRYCTIKGERSGGYVLTARLDDTFEHGHYNPIQTRLKKGYTRLSKERAIHRMFYELKTLESLAHKRELVYQIAESHDINLDRVDKIAEGEGRSIVYTDMDIADIEFWQIELAKFPLIVKEQ